MKKAQAAMEYLMTYGWAILIVIVVVAALYAMGVFRIGAPAVPCSPCFSYFAYIDYAAGTLLIRNGAREVVLDSLVGNTTEWAFSPTFNTTVTPGTTLTITGITTGATYDVTLTYTDTSSNLQHTDSATIRG